MGTRRVRSDHSPPPPQVVRESRVAPRAIAWAAGCGLIYLTIAGGFRFRFEPTRFTHHMAIADGMLHGHVYARPEVIAARNERLKREFLARFEREELERGGAVPPERREARAVAWARQGTDHDWTIVDGRYYGYWGPMTSAAMIPFVAAFGPGASDRLANALIGAINVGLFYLWMRRFERVSGLAIREACRGGLTVLFAFGTVHFYQACGGRVWMASQLVALTFVLAACIAICGPRPGWRSAMLAGLFLSLAALTRSVTAVFGLFFVTMIWLRGAEVGVGRWWRFAVQVAAFGVPCIAAVGVQAAYNHARFGSYRDDGLATQLETTANRRFKGDFEKYGLFSTHYLKQNVESYFLTWRPVWRPDGTMTYNAYGNSMFVVTPPLLYALLAWRYRSRYTAALVVGAVPLLLTLMFFIGTGWVQFGNRYLLDAMPFLLMLVACGMRGRLTLVSYVLIVLAVAVNLWGVYRWDLSLFEPLAAICRRATMALLVFVAIGVWGVVMLRQRARQRAICSR